jgi:hypothetical protein
MEFVSDESKQALIKILLVIANEVWQSPIDTKAIALGFHPTQ